MIETTERSKTDWDAFRAFEKEKHHQFFLPQYQCLGMKVVHDIFDDTKTNDYDVIVEIGDVATGKRYTVDEKARQNEYMDLLVEVMQCIRDGRIGWIYKSIDYIFYASWPDKTATEPSSAYMIRVPNLRDFIVENWEQLPDHFSSKGYGLTLNKKVNWQDLIYLKIATKIV